MRKMSEAEFQRLIDRDLPLAHWLGFRIESIGQGRARLRLPFRDEFVRPGGTIAGPAMMALADCAMYAVVLGEKGDALMAVTSSLTVHFLRAPRPVDMIAEAALLRLGRRLAVSEVRLFSTGDEVPVAHVTGTYALPGPARQEGASVP
jgi:uncharacterized protein (TIGR00369 family)